MSNLDKNEEAIKILQKTLAKYKQDIDLLKVQANFQRKINWAILISFYISLAIVASAPLISRFFSE